MEITEVRIKLMEDSEDRLRAFCSITFDHCFVVRDLKIIDGINGPFVAMPSRKLTGHCQRCGHKNHLRAQFCNQCGTKLKGAQETASDSPQKLYADVAHPINSACREQIQNAVIDELQAELGRSGEPGYRSRYDDEFQDAGPESDGDESSDYAPADHSDRDVHSKRQPATDERSERSAHPPKPHFSEPNGMDREKAAEPAQGEDDSFGAGIF